MAATGALFHPFRALGYITADVPFAVQRRGRNTFLTVSAGKAWQIYNCAKLTLIFVGQTVRRARGRRSRASRQNVQYPAAAGACGGWADALPCLRAAGAQHHRPRLQGRLHLRGVRPARGRVPEVRNTRHTCAAEQIRALGVRLTRRLARAERTASAPGAARART
jgi:hypothetical protein